MAKQMQSGEPQEVVRDLSKTYRMVAWARKKWPNAVTHCEGQVVALSGEDIQVEAIPTKDGPGSPRTIPGATQEQLRHLYEVDRNHLIEAVAAKNIA